MDLRVSMRCLDCPYTVTFYGALFKDVSCPWQRRQLASSEVKMKLSKFCVGLLSETSVYI